MIRARLSQFEAAIGATRVGGDAAIAGVSTDTRSLAQGNLFVALAGEHHDGHDHLAAAEARGASAALVARALPVSLPQLVVTDTLLALGDLARWWRTRVPARAVAITGSNGKSTLKNLSAAIFALAGQTAATAGNLNNEIGLPLTVLGLGAQNQYAVLEMGAGKPGDIEYLARIARPDVAVVNNVGPAHLERLGTLEGVAETKAEIYRNLAPDGVAVINADDRFAAFFKQRAGTHRVVTFGLAAGQT
jgi:UDP-N-acetylmuramoyl-tripeptide--D-alanyl-D-alanine ligase